uniref:uncharacterized protein LOC117245763 n=1 Tax=Epinephelus lanceolatus TaxID=310571 RepID=UPI0014489CB7|nr:uncharacterized protein LOC117245763 [Epinephelus lanceolatus]
MASSFLSFSLLFISLYTADGFLEYSLNRCVFNSTDPKDIEYMQSYYFNKVEDVRFSSSLGKFVGYTEPGLKNAEAWNNDPSLLAQMRGEKERYCVNHVEAFYPHALTKSAEPYVVLSSTTPSGGKHSAMLVCSVFDFYPKKIKVIQADVFKVCDSLLAFTDKMEYLEGQSRRNNLVFDEIKDSQGDTWAETEEKVKKVLAEKLQMNQVIKMERAHRTGKPGGGRPRPIVVKFLRYKDRTAILRRTNSLKGTKIYINEDFTDTVRRKRKDLRERGDIAYL